jgi:hypothetical protein
MKPFTEEYAMRNIATLFLAALMLASLHAVAPAGIIDDSRTIEWSKAGVKGGIPNRPIGRNCRTQDGAVGDGVADDTAAIRACVSNTPPGTAAYLPSGTYKITGSISMPSNKTFAGRTCEHGNTLQREHQRIHKRGHQRIDRLSEPPVLPFRGVHVVGSPAKGHDDNAIGHFRPWRGSVVVISRLGGGTKVSMAGPRSYRRNVPIAACATARGR